MNKLYCIYTMGNYSAMKKEETTATHVNMHKFHNHYAE